MTVSTEISSNEYTGNGVTTDFDYKFRIFKANQLSVITSDADGDNVVTLRLGTDYTVTGANKSAGGKVILTKPLANGHKISIARDIPITQETSFRNQSKFFAETHEDAFDYLTMLMQRLWGNLGLFLKRPSILANWFDAKGYRIASLGKPKSDSDAVDLGTLKDKVEGVNSTILKKEKRTLRVDDIDISSFPKAPARRNKQIGFDNSGRPTLLDPIETGALGYQLVDSFEKGATLAGRFQALFWEEKKKYFRWDGPLPKVVPPNSTPNETGGIKSDENPNGIWVDVGEASLRSELKRSSVLHLPPIATLLNLNYSNGKIWESGHQANNGEWFVFDNDGTPEVWDGIGTLGNEPAHPFQRIATKPPLISRPILTKPEMPKPKVCFVSFRASDQMKYLELAFRVGDIAEDVSVVLKGFSSNKAIEISENPSGIGVVYVAQDDKIGTNPTYLKSAVTTSISNGELTVTLAKSSVPVGRFCRFSIRCVDADAYFDKAIAYIGSDIVAHSSLSRMGTSLYKEFVDSTCDFSVKSQVSGNSFISRDNLIRIALGGGDSLTSEILSLKKAYQYYASARSSITRIMFEGGVFYEPLRQRQWIIRGDCDIWAPNGATILGGVEMKTGAWVQVENPNRPTYYCLYDASTNPDSAIRNGTKQPFVYVEMQQRSIESAFTRELRNVSSIDTVKSTDFSYYYEHTTGRLYFSWNNINQNAYLYVCESDAVIFNDGSFNVSMWGVTATSAKVNDFDFRSATYSSSEFGGPIAKLYDCNASVAVVGNGFSMNNYDCVLYNCNGKSVGNDGAGFHNNGVSYIIGGSYSNNSDDGISHHENCVGYVIGSHLKYNGAGNSTPAFGAKVYHWDVVSRKATVTKTKPYAGTLACISGQGFDKTEAYYFTCDTDNGYFAESQQAGTTATLYAISRAGSNIEIKSTESTLVVKS
ncbi:hypothetical protein [Providencia sp. PROV024]|uniref:tail fiber/spike domain-containing protein n=2 Tax=Providencia sp. PROV024 TaxID=2949758 RepID=UPI002934A65A|nr:hypothetical protein [Providencia sp. PROV024]WOC02440.1 hypothetical protein P3L56_11365 [Providencia sp. PROV024]